MHSPGNCAAGLGRVGACRRQQQAGDVKGASQHSGVVLQEDTSLRHLAAGLQTNVHAALRAMGDLSGSSHDNVAA